MIEITRLMETYLKVFRIQIRLHLESRHLMDMIISACILYHFIMVFYQRSGPGPLGPVRNILVVRSGRTSIYQVRWYTRIGNRLSYLTLLRLVLSLSVTFCVGLKAPNSVCLMSLPAFIESEMISSVIEHEWC